MNWTYFILGMIAYQIGKMFLLVLHKEIDDRRQRKFIKLVSISFPDKKDIRFIAVDSSDKRAMANIERQLRADWDLPKDPPKLVRLPPPGPKKSA